MTETFRPLEIQGIPANNIYVFAANEWSQLKEFFGVESSAPPRIILFNGDAIKKGGKFPVHEISIFPALDTNDIDFLNYQKEVSKNSSYLAYYNPELKAAFFNTSSIYNRGADNLGLPIIEEVTHHLVRIPRSRLTISPVTLCEFSARSLFPNSGLDLYMRMMNSNSDIKVDLHEFFPILAENFRGSQATFSLPSLTGLSDRSVLHALSYLPKQAAIELLKQNNYNAVQVIENYPQLPHLDGPTLWNNFCLPLLRGEKLN